jgi:hypothetical protein
MPPETEQQPVTQPVVQPNGTAGSPPVNQPFYSTFEDADLKGFAELKKLNSPADAVKGWQSAEKLLGVPAEQLLRIPGADAKPEDFNPIYDRLGRPKDATEYKLPIPEGDNGEFAKKMAPILHKHGLTSRQAEGLANDWNGVMIETAKTMAEEQNIQETADLESLKKEWGGAYDQRVELGRRAVRQFAPDQETLGALEKSLGTAKLIKLFAKIGEGLGEAKPAGFDTESSGTFGLTPAAAKAKLTELETDKDWGKRFHGGGAAERAQRDNLLRIISSAT